MIKIEQINLYHLRMPLKSHFETSFGKITTRDSIIIEIIGDGLRGYGECVADKDPGYSYETSDTAWLILKDFVAPKFLGRELKSIEKYYADVSFIKGHPMAKAGFEMAMWDLWGKITGKSLKEMLGGKKQQVEVGVSVGIQETSNELVNWVRKYLDDGYQRIKVKIKPGRDVGDIARLRNEFPTIKLQVDANSAYSIGDMGNIVELDEFNLLMIEQPFAEDDLWDHHQLQKKLKTPICLDESILSGQHARKAIEMDACRVINIKPGRVGGLLEGVIIHNVCLENNIPVWCGGMLETGVGRAANLAIASLEGFKFPGDISATDRYYDLDITEERFVLNENSTIDVPDKPGLGITINRKHLEQFVVRKGSFV